MPNIGRIWLGSFNLFFGRNEDGKTLTIDALVKLLLGRNIRDFEHIDRVGETPEGYVIIEDDKGKEIKLPEKGNLTKVVGLTPSECRNIFVIRNSDLCITHESEFYINVTDRLTGLRTEKISKIKEILRDLSKITPSGIFRDIKEEKLKTRIENAKGLMGKIETLNRVIKEEGFDEVEEELVRWGERKDGVIQKTENLEEVRRRKKYEKGKEALDKLKKALEETEASEIYNKEDEQLWRDGEKDIQTYNKGKEALLTDLKEDEEVLKETSKKLREKERDFQVSDERKKKLDNEVKPELRIYEIKSQDLAFQEGKSNFFTSIGIISAILLGISLLGVITRPSLLLYILALLFSISTVVSGIFKFQFVKDKASLAGALERIKLTLSELELSADSIKGILSNTQRFNEEYGKNVADIQQLKRRKENLEDKVEELKSKTVPDMGKKIRDAKDKIEEIKRKSEEKSFRKYANKLK